MGLVICRKASDFLKPGYQTGFTCRVCSEPLQVSLLGLSAIEKGAIPTCNTCGFAIQERLNNAKAPMTVVMSPEARAQLEQIAQTLTENQRPKC
jgi:transcription elongation factor Elf1